MKILKKIIHKINYEFKILTSILVYPFILKNYQIEDEVETVNKIIKYKKSLARFGDGEFKWMWGVKQISFQKDDDLLASELKRVLNNKNEDLLIGIPKGIISIKEYTYDAKKVWRLFVLENKNRINESLSSNKVYENTNITRCYIDYKNKKDCLFKFNNLKRIWENRDVIIVEGEKTRIGVGNDLLNNCKSIKRILAPSTNAFDKYKEILKECLNQNNSSLFILALGPTATVLASDLCDNGFQAIDIGHIDVEYEWFKMGVKTKKPIKGKYVNEAGNGIVDDTILKSDEKYIKSIISIIE